MNIISVENISKIIGVKSLFKDISFGVEDNSRIGIIGANGCGKSTLLKILAGGIDPDYGNISAKLGLRIEYLPQNPEFDEQSTVLENIFSRRSEIAQLVSEYELVCDLISESPDDKKLLARMAEIARGLDAHQAWEYERYAKKILNQLGVTRLHDKVCVLSGGMRKRIALAHALLSESDVLLLDEPTNHLDADTIEWLEEYIANYKGAVVLVTHDRYFLDRVTNTIIEIEKGELNIFNGNFSFYIGRKNEMAETVAKLERRKRTILRKELEWLQRGAKARSTKQKARIDRIHALRNVNYEQDQSLLKFTIQTRRLSKNVVDLRSISKSYGAHQIIKTFNYQFSKGERLGIVGSNGSGKTTFVKILTETIRPDEGEVVVGKTVSFGYLDQECENLPPDMKAIDYIKKEGGEALRTMSGDFLPAEIVMEMFLFTHQMQCTPIRKLSGGEKRRLELIRMLMRDPNFIILDEPTNDLDIPTLQALEDFLDAFDGCILTISHDRYFLDRVVDHLFVFENGKIRSFPGNYSDYIIVKKEEEQRRSQERAEKKETKPREKSEEQRSLKLSFNEQRELNTLNELIPKLEEELKSVEEEIAVNVSDYKKLSEYSAKRDELNTRIEEALMRWEELSVKEENSRRKSQNET